jgi:hypothetical protein
MLSIAAKDSSGLLRWSTTGDWLEQEWPSGSSNHHVKVRDNMTSSFNTILGIKILADAATLLNNTEDETKYLLQAINVSSKSFKLPLSLRPLMTGCTE